MTALGWQRRARPALGTLVEVGLPVGSLDAEASFDAAFACIQEVQDALSRFEAASDVSRFHRLKAGQGLRMRPVTRAVLDAAAELRDATDGLFDVTLGSAPNGWRCDGDLLRKLDAGTRLDLGGIGKGYAVDRAADALAARGIAAGWVNAGGDLRAFGDVALPIWLRDETAGGARHFASLQDGAFATSHFGPASASKLAHDASAHGRVHASVAAPRCVWADALTKVVAASGSPDHPVLARYDAAAWIH